MQIKVCVVFSSSTDPPDSVLYPADDIQLGTENNLICFVDNFYPPSIRVTWTKNGRPVSEGVSLSQYFPNRDQTFHMFSTLKFTPGEWDIYSCTVVHSALEEPKTKTWGDYLVFYLEFLLSCCVVWVMTSFLCNVFHRTRLLWREPWSRCFLWAGPDSGLAGRHSCSFSDCQSTTQAVIHSVQQREMYYLIFIMSDLHSEINLLPCVLCE